MKTRATDVGSRSRLHVRQLFYGMYAEATGVSLLSPN